MIINNLIIYDNPIYQINAERLVKYISDKDGWVANSTMISSDSLSSNYIGTLVSSIDRDTRIISMSPSSTMMLYNLPEDPNYNKYQIMKSGTINNKQLEFVEVNGHDDNIGEKLFDQLLQYYNLSVAKSNTHPPDDSDPLLNNLDIKTATNYYELYEYYVNHLQGKSMIAYDLETNSGDIYNSTDSRVIGFSLSEVGSKSGIYVLFESSDYKMPIEDKKLCEDLLNYILSDNNVTLVIQNIAFEIPQTRTWLGIELPYERVEDTMVQSRMRVFRGVGLKNQVMLNLGYKDWSEDLDKVLSSVGMLLNSSYNDGLRYIMKCLTAIKDNDLSQFSSTNDFIHKVMNDNTNIDFHTKLSKVTKKCQGLWSAIVTLDNVLSKYQDVDPTIKTTYWEYLVKNINELEVTGQVHRGAYFYDLPSKLISRYGALDAILTGELYEFNKIVLKSDSNKYGIDLFDGYKLFLRHQYLAMIFGSNGMYWDEDRVLYYEKLVMDQGLKHLIEMLKFRTPYIMSELKYSLRGRMIDYDMNRDYGLLHHIQLHPNFVKIDQDGKITMLVARKTGKSAGKLVNKSYPRDKYINLYDFMSRKYMDELFNSYIDTYLNDIITRDDYTMFDLLEDININSPIIGKTIIQEFINTNMEDYVTGEVFEVLPPQVEALSGILGIDHPIVQSIKMYADNKDKLGLYDWYLDNMNSLKLVQDGKFKLGLNLVNQINNSILANSYRTREEHYMLDKSKFDASKLDLVTKKTDSSIDVYYGTPEWWIKQWSDRADINSDLTLGADEESMISLYKKITCCSNIDVDRPETWTDAYRFLYHYRSFKKCFKIKATYIDGDALGRNTVSLASKSKTQNGEVPIRTKHYVPKDQLGPDDIYISMIPFRPFSAATGRWTSGMHTVPWKSPAREFYGSRFYGGIVIAPDYSQAEVRVLASSSQEENLLRAYAEGIDVHGMTAEGIFGKDYTEAQRRFSKMGMR